MVLGLLEQLVLLLGVAVPCGVEGHGRHRPYLLAQAYVWKWHAGFELSINITVGWYIVRLEALAQHDSKWWCIVTRAATQVHKGSSPRQLAGELAQRVGSRCVAIAQQIGSIYWLKALAQHVVLEGDSPGARA
jgi:hypothetical protein